MKKGRTIRPKKVFRYTKNQTKNTAATEKQMESKIPVITVVGVGGGGTNTVNYLKSVAGNEIRVVVMNTDKQALERSVVENKVLLFDQQTKGNSAKGDPTLGFEAAMENKSLIEQSLAGSDLVIVVAGFGGGTGTGASIVVAEIAKSLGADVLAMVTTPFAWEGKTVKLVAEEGIEALQEVADNVVVLHNEDLKAHLKSIGEPSSLTNAFGEMYRIIAENIQALSDAITASGLINLTYEDYQQIFRHGNETTVSIGEASGKDRGSIAVEKALKNAFLTFDVKEAKGLVLSVTGGTDFTYDDLDKASETLHEAIASHRNAQDTDAPSEFPSIMINAFLNEASVSNGNVKASLLAVK